MSERNTCPVCGRPVEYRGSQIRQVVGCSGHPECAWTTSVYVWSMCDCDPDAYKELVSGNASNDNKERVE